MHPQVIHSIPGRLRIHIPALKKVNVDQQEVVTAILSGFRTPQFILDTNVNYVSGNLLVIYDNKISSESQVLNWIDDIKNIAEHILFKFFTLEKNKLDKAKSELMQFLKTESAKGCILDRGINIPDEIWN
jgi:uncharacterized protein YpuA (DUF1002 family)